MSVMPRLSITGIAAASRDRRAPSNGVGVGRGPRQRVRPGGPGEVVEAQAQHDGPADPVGGAHAAGDPLDQPDQGGVEALGATGSAGRGRAASRSTRAAGRPAPAGGRGCGPGRGDGGRRRGRASRRVAASGRRGHLADGARCRARAAWPRSPARRPRDAAPAAGGGRPVRRRAPRRAGRRAWPRRWPPWPGTWCGPPRR